MLPEKRAPMRKVREILRLHFEAHLSERQISKICLVGKGTVRRYLKRLEAAGLSWPLPADLDEAALEKKLFPPPPPPSAGERPAPDCAQIHKELKSPNVTLQLLWEEYKQVHPDGYNYSWYCELYREWARHVDIVLRQEHHAGEKMFVDHAGQTVPVIDRATGETRDTYVFVAVLGASNYTYAEATWTRGLWDWIGSHVRTFEFFRGCTRLVVPDNWRSGVKQACYYEPELNRTYNDMAIHYGVGILPARPYRARDKAKAEQGVQVVQRWILAALRKRRFFSLTEVNEAIAELLEKLNRRPFRKLPGSRVELYNTIDLPALRPLPLTPYLFAEWKKARVSIDYHVDLERHYYSVPYQLVGKQVEIRYTASLVEVLYQGNRVASHQRNHRAGAHTTNTEHRPKSHQRYLAWTPSRIIDWAATVGPFTARLAESIMAERPHPEQGFRSCMGLIALGRRYGNDRLEAASTRAVRLKAHRYQSVKSILSKGLDQQPLPELTAPPSPVEHDNIRGPGYYADLQATLFEEVAG
jgi:transposase